MKTNFLKLLTFTLVILLASCNQQATVDYKYNESPKVLPCEMSQSALYNEAIHTFENDIKVYFDKQNQTASKAYTGFVTNAISKRIKFEEVASEHAINIAKALKNDSSIWTNTNEGTSFNLESSLGECVVENIKSKNLKTSFNALISTNSMRPNLVLTPIKNYARQTVGDNGIKAYLAFECYYSKLLNMEASQLKKPVEPAKPAVKNVDFNKKPQAANPVLQKK